MFFDGNLQAGIARALQDNKPVACFVRGLYDPPPLVEKDQTNTLLP